MVATNLLNTQTANYLDLVGNGKRYEAPLYQRDYSWSEEQWEDLWNDIFELLQRPSDRHYMGALVVEGKSDREFLIIDGQQRLATLSIFALAVIARLNEMSGAEEEVAANRERAERLRARFIGEKDPASLIESSKLSLNSTDNAFYQDYLVQLRTPRNPRGLPKSNRLLWACFQFFSRKLQQLPRDTYSGEAIARLLSETVGRQLLFILIAVDDEINAYTVFETLNARGLELSSTDLLKNYLFSRITVPADLDALQRRWTRLLGTVSQEQFPEFLRFHLQTTHGKIRTVRLFKIVRDSVDSPAAVFDLMDALESRAELFAALADEHSTFWVDLPEAKSFVRDLNLFRARQITPLLFATWERFSRADFVRVLKLVSVITFRYSVVGGLNPNALESAYQDAAHSVLAEVITSPAGVYHRLSAIYIDDEKFRSDFSRFTVETSGQRQRLAKYILAMLAEHVSGRSCDPDTDPGTIEHILPENPAEAWEDMFPPVHWPAAVYSLGNLTLLEGVRNRLVGNGSYVDKVTAYATSSYEITRLIATQFPDEWTPARLESRQQRLADRAVHRWRADFTQQLS